MRKSIVRSFLVAQALIGVALTTLWLAGEWESRFMAALLFRLGAFLLICAFIPGTWIRTPDRLKDPMTREISNQDLPSTRPTGKSKFAVWNRFSIELILTSVFVFITALLLRYVAPMPGA